jgi:hypothetical protein
MSAAAGSLIEVEGLTKHFPIRRGVFGREVGSDDWRLPAAPRQARQEQEREQEPSDQTGGLRAQRGR